MRAIALSLILVAGAAAAEAPQTSLRPVARPGSTEAAPAPEPAEEAPATAEEAPAAAEVEAAPALPALPEPTVEGSTDSSILMTLLNAGVTPEATPELPEAEQSEELPALPAEAIEAIAPEAEETAAPEATTDEAAATEPEAEVEGDGPDVQEAEPAQSPEPEAAPPETEPTETEEESRLDTPDAATATVSSNATQPWYEIDASQFAPAASVRPVAREVPDPITRTGAEARAELFNVALSRFAPARSLRPDVRPPSIVQLARAAQQERAAQLALQQQGAVCGDIRIQGDTLGSHPGPGACGVDNAVRVRAVAGIRLSQPAILDCNTAKTLRRWVDEGMKPIVGNEGGGPVSMHVMAHYACRNRIGTGTSRISQHAFGHAIDIGAIRLEDGSSISVLRGWGTSDDGSQLRQMHRAACGMFGTVLGPEANAAHRDHFHFDTAQYRSSSYCR